MGMALGTVPIQGLTATLTKVIGDWDNIALLSSDSASTYDISLKVNEIIAELVDKSPQDINYMEELDPETASMHDISHSINKILIFLKLQNDFKLS